MKKFLYRFLIVVLAFGMLTPTWLISSIERAKAAAAVSGGGSAGSEVVNGTSADFFLNPIVIISQNDGDINKINDLSVSINDSTSAHLQFDPVGSLSVQTTGTIDLSAPHKTADLIKIPVTKNSIAGDVVTISGIKVKATDTGTTDVFKGNAKLQVNVNGDTTIFGFGDPINIDAQIPVIQSVETGDLNANGQIDAVKVTFSENILNSTITATDFSLAGGYVGQPFVSNTNGDVADNNYIYLTYSEIATPDTFDTPILTYTAGVLTDLVGNLLSNVAIVSINNYVPAAPANLTATVGDGEVSLTWSPVAGVNYYNVYYQKSSDMVYVGPVAVTGTSTKIIGLQNGVMYRFIVRAVRVNGTTVVESANAWLESTPTAPVVVSEVEQAATFVSTEPVVSQEVAPITPQTPDQPTTPIEQGQIKSAETPVTSESEKINWTPWIILFILIILAGAATGGYFYWFGRDEEEELISREVLEKNKKSVGKKPEKTSQKSKRW